MANYVPTGWKVESTEAGSHSHTASFFRGMLRLRSYRTGEVLVLRFSCLTISRTIGGSKLSDTLGPLGMELKPQHGTTRGIGEVEAKEFRSFGYHAFPAAAHVLTFGTSPDFLGSLEGFDVGGGGMTIILFRSIDRENKLDVSARLRLPALGSRPLPGFVLSCGLANITVDYNESALYFARTHGG